MIDITPRNQNYSSTMGSTNYERQSNSPPPHHSTSYARDRELNDAEGKSALLDLLLKACFLTHFSI